MESTSQTIYQTIQLTACKTLCHSINLADSHKSHWKGSGHYQQQVMPDRPRRKKLENPCLAPSTYPQKILCNDCSQYENCCNMQLQHDTGHALPFCVDVKNTFSYHGIPANILTFDCHTP
jgi:hypothetical protein